MSAELLKQHGKKVAGTAATGGLGGVMVWALMTFTPISQHDTTRREIQTLRERVSVLEYAVEHQIPPAVAAGKPSITNAAYESPDTLTTETTFSDDLMFNEVTGTLTATRTDIDFDPSKKEGSDATLELRP